MVDARKENRDLVFAVNCDGSLARLFLRGSEGVVSCMALKAAPGAFELTDVIVVVILVCHWLLTDGAVLAVIVDTFVGLFVCREPVSTEIDSAGPVLAEACDERVVGIEDQGHVIVDSLADNALDELGMAVPGHLVPVKVVDHVVLGMEELKDMSKFCNGLRLFLASDPFECVISSICSANNSIKRWTKSVSQIKQNWGARYGDYYIFPKSNDLAEVYLDEEDEFNSSNIQDINECNNNLKKCGVGYRAPYMRKASELFTLEMDLSEIFSMTYDEAFETIIKVPGVGPKVADCILLYGFNFREAFPSDVWIKRIVSYLYFDGKDISVSKVREFGMEEFGKNAGYVQLYMFHYARMSGLMNKLK